MILLLLAGTGEARVIAAKLAQGAVDLHSKRSQVDFGVLAEWAGEARVREANTALEAYEIAGAPLVELVAREALAAAEKILGPVEGVALDVVVIDRQGGIIARAGA